MKLLIWIERAGAWVTSFMEDLQRRENGIDRGLRKPQILKTRYYPWSHPTDRPSLCRQWVTPYRLIVTSLHYCRRSYGAQCVFATKYVEYSKSTVHDSCALSSEEHVLHCTTFKRVSRVYLCECPLCHGCLYWLLYRDELQDDADRRYESDGSVLRRWFHECEWAVTDPRFARVSLFKFVGSWKSRLDLRQCYIPMDVRIFVDFGATYEENYEKCG